MTHSATSRFAAHDSHLAQLCNALEAGWRIEQPVYLRYQWFGQNEQGYYFILKRGAGVDLLVVTDCEEVRRWVRTHRLRVIAS